jgi:hypothetical protein
LEFTLDNGPILANPGVSIASTPSKSSAPPSAVNDLLKYVAGSDLGNPTMSTDIEVFDKLVLPEQSQHSTTVPASCSANGPSKSRQKPFCRDCRLSFSTKINYNRHRREQHTGKRYNCGACHKSYSRNDYFQTHRCRAQLGRPRHPLGCSRE